MATKTVLETELYEALKELSYLEPLCDDGDPLLTSARNAAKAAIRKAEATNGR